MLQVRRPSSGDETDRVAPGPSVSRTLSPSPPRSMPELRRPGLLLRPCAYYSTPWRVLMPPSSRATTWALS
eukprot:7138754-Lingulodinium_polyedra.AAC.1